MTKYTVELSETHERALDHQRTQNGAGLTREQWVQFQSTRNLENHALTMKDEVVEKLAALDDAGLAEAVRKRQELLDERKAEQEQIEREEAEKATALKEREAQAAEAAVTPSKVG